MFIEKELCWKGATLARVECSCCVVFFYKHVMPLASVGFEFFNPEGWHVYRKRIVLERYDPGQGRIFVMPFFL